MGLVEDTIKAYEFSAKDYVLKHSDISAIEWEAGFFATNLDGNRVLDVGCGPGRDAKYFSDSGCEVTGIDLVPEFLKIAREKVPKGKFYSMDMRRMGFKDDYFDGIWSMASFLHIPRNEADKTMKEHVRVLKQKGIMFISTLEGDGEDPLPPSPKYGGYSKFFYGYEENEFKELLKSSGFSIENFDKDVRSEKLIFFNILARKK